MALPSDDPIRKLAEKFDEHAIWLVAQLERYEDMRQAYLDNQERLTTQQRNEMYVTLLERASVLDTAREQFDRFYDRFIALLERILDNQVQEELAGIDAELRQLWCEHRQS